MCPFLNPVWKRLLDDSKQGVFSTKALNTNPKRVYNTCLKLDVPTFPDAYNLLAYGETLSDTIGTCLKRCFRTRSNISVEQTRFLK